MISGWEFFKIYHSLHLHLTSKTYDVLKYNGKTRVKQEAFYKRRDKLKFDYYASKFHNKTKAGQFIIANLIYGTDKFIYQPYADGEEVYLKWKKISDTMSYTFEKDLSKVSDLIDQYKVDIFDKHNDHAPLLLQSYLGHTVTAETIVILNKEHHDFLDTWMEICQNDPYMVEVIIKLKKYQPFVKYNKEKIRQLIKEFNF